MLAEAIFEGEEEGILLAPFIELFRAILGDYKSEGMGPERVI